MISILDEKISLLPFGIVMLIYASLLLLIVIVALWRRWLTPSGILGAFVLGFIVLYFGGFSAFSIFFFFFASCSMLSKIKRSYNKREKKGSRRDLGQVLANGLPAVTALFLSRTPSFYRIAIIAYSAAIAEAVADTWESTFGIMSRRGPVSIITFTPVPKGISGGVTLLGLLSGALGSLLTAFLHYLIIAPSWRHFLIISGVGFLSSIMDSVLGATVQEHYRKSDGTLTEKEYEDGVKNERAKGIKGFDNDVVNLVSGFLSLSLSLFIASLTL